MLSLISAPTLVPDSAKWNSATKLPKNGLLDWLERATQYLHPLPGELLNRVIPFFFVYVSSGFIFEVFHIFFCLFYLCLSIFSPIIYHFRSLYLSISLHIYRSILLYPFIAILLSYYIPSSFYLTIFLHLSFYLTLSLHIYHSILLYPFISILLSYYIPSHRPYFTSVFTLLSYNIPSHRPFYLTIFPHLTFYLTISLHIYPSIFIFLHIGLSILLYPFISILSILPYSFT